MNINTNYNALTLNTSSVSKTSNSGFTKILNEQISSKSQTINTQHFGNVSKKDFENSIKRLLEKMDTIVKSATQTGQSNAKELDDLKRAFQAQVDVYHLVLGNIAKADLAMSSNNEVAKNAKDLANNLSFYTMLSSGLPEIAKDFFSAAGMSSEVQADIAKIQKYTDDNHKKANLDNGKTISYGDAIEKDLKSKYVSIRINDDSDDRLLEYLLQIRNTKN